MNIPFDKLYCISCDSELTKEECNNALLDFVSNKYICGKRNYHDKQYEVKKKAKNTWLAWGIPIDWNKEGGDDESKDLPA